MRIRYGGRVDPHALGLLGLPEDVGDLVDRLEQLLGDGDVGRLLDVTRAVHAVPEQLVQIRELLEVLLGEEVRPQHHQVMLDLLGALLLDDDRAGAEVVIVGVVELLQRLQARKRLDLGLGGIVDAAVQVAVGMGRGGVGEKSMQHGLNLPFEGARATILCGSGHCAGSPSSRTRCARRCSPGDGLLALRGGAPRRGQLRVFRDPTLPSRWLVKRVGDVHGAGLERDIRGPLRQSAGAPGAVDSHEFGWVPAAGSYRVVWTVSTRRGSRRLMMRVRLRTGQNLRILI